MTCPSCDTRMSEWGCHQDGRPFHHCPYCGTARTCDGVTVVPLLVHNTLKKFDRLFGGGEHVNPMPQTAEGQ